MESILESSKRGGGSEYFVGGSPGVNIQVNLIGGVRNPGIYHLPENTDLLTLVGYGGGTSEAAVLDDVNIKRKEDGKFHNIGVDMDAILKSPDTPNPALANGDVVYIPEKRTVRNLAVAVSIVASLLSIAAAGYTVSHLSK
ncbi:MAG: SLBB domain-containing protein [Bacteriovoracia bacterium]